MLGWSQVRSKVIQLGVHLCLPNSFLDQIVAECGAEFPVQQSRAQGSDPTELWCPRVLGRSAVRPCNSAAPAPPSPPAVRGDPAPTLVTGSAGRSLPALRRVWAGRPG